MWRSSSSVIVGQVAALELDRAADDPAVLAQVAHDGERHGGLAAAGFAHEPHRLARHDGAGEIHHRRDFAQAGEEARSRGSRFRGSGCDGSQSAMAPPLWRRCGPGVSHPRPPWDIWAEMASHQSFRLSSRRPSASRFRPRTRLISASAGTTAGWGNMRQELAAVVDGRAPVRAFGRDAEAEEAERAEQDRGVADPQAEIDDQRPARVGQDFPQHDVPRAFAAGLAAAT